MTDPKAFTWDVRLALQLLKGTGKLNLAGEDKAQKTEFWEGYLRLLPSPESLCQPLCLSPQALDEFQHGMLKAGALAQQARLRMLLPDMMPAEDAPASSFPSPLQWAFACVRSRAFVVTDKSSSSAGGAEGAGGARSGEVASEEELGGGVAEQGGRAEKGGKEDAAVEDTSKEPQRFEEPQRFTPSAAAVAEAKEAARKSGGFAMLIPAKTAEGMSGVAGAVGGGDGLNGSVTNLVDGQQAALDAEYAQDRFAFVPFLDMTNHDAEPNADFSCEGQRSLAVAVTCSSCCCHVVIFANELS